MALDDGQEELAVQYVLGELPAADARAFERRLQADDELAAEVRRLRDTLGLLPYAAVAEPPPELRGQIVAAAHAEHRRRAAPSARARRVPWSGVATALAASIALAFGIDAYRTRQELVLQQQVASLLLEPNVVRAFSLAGGGAFGRVALDMDSQRGAVVLERVAALPTGQIYRLWAQVADRAVPCGDFGVQPDGRVRAPFRVPVGAYTAPIEKLFVTIEPQGAGDRPTGPVVMKSV
jgi:anti-sigma-K factor RskA